MGPEAALALQLIVKFGVPMAQDLWKLFKDKTEVTPEMWAEARAINARPIEFYEEEAKAPTA